MTLFIEDPVLQERHKPEFMSQRVGITRFIGNVITGDNSYVWNILVSIR